MAAGLVLSKRAGVSKTLYGMVMSKEKYVHGATARRVKSVKVACEKGRNGVSFAPLQNMAKGAVRTAAYTPAIVPYDNALRFLIQPETDQEIVYLVDLEEWQCDCEHFRMRKPAMCKHLEALLLAGRNP
jgi:hypothetical protein